MLERFKVPEKDRVYVAEGQIRTATEAIFRHSGVSVDEAARSTDVLITNDLRGVESPPPNSKACANQRPQ